MSCLKIRISPVFVPLVSLGVVCAGCSGASDVRVDDPDGSLPGDASEAGASGPDGGGAPEVCDPTKEPKDSPSCVSSEFGVFVAPSGNDTNDGTRETPLKTIAAGLRLAASTAKARVYACAGTYEEKVSIQKGIELYGGFACSDWRYLGNPSRIAPQERGIALMVSGVQEPVLLVDFEISAKDGSDPGESSIAAFVTESTEVRMRRVHLVAGAGVAGSTPGDIPNYASVGPDGERYSPALGLSGRATTNTCPAPLANSRGGAEGGASGNQGQPGEAAIDPPDPEGATGAGGRGYADFGSAQCESGRHGSNGLPGAGGYGAPLYGTLTTEGWSGRDGQPGGYGGTGQGGGGGGRRFSPDGGGGGGPGGCGGRGGGPGQAGGSSFALLSVTSNMFLEQCTIRTGPGGAGGGGGRGQVAQASSRVVPGGTVGLCNGGRGGHGGSGGGGGGGAGGLSLGIGYREAPPILDGSLVRLANTFESFTLGAAGDAGPGGAGGSATTNPQEVSPMRFGRAGADGTLGMAGYAAAIRALP